MKNLFYQINNHLRLNGHTAILMILPLMLMFNAAICLGEWVSFNPNLGATFGVKVQDYNNLTIFRENVTYVTANAGITWPNFSSLNYSGHFNNFGMGYLNGGETYTTTIAHSYSCGFGGMSTCYWYETVCTGVHLYIEIRGSNWTWIKSEDLPCSNGGISDFVFIKDFYSVGDIGFAVGTNGKIKKTINKGASWTNITSGTTNYLQSVYFINESIGWSAGTQGTIIKTTDGGNTWVPQNSNVTQNINEMQFIDENTGWAVGEGATIIKTTDGGSHWTTQNSGLNSTIKLNALKFINSMTGWIVGTSSTALKTIDGGNSWTQVDIGYPNENLGWVYFTQSNKIYIGSASGLLVKWEGVIPPILAQPNASNILDHSAQVNSEVLEDGGAEINARGICWNTSGNPTINDNVVPEGTGLGTFQSQLSNLDGYTRYYIKSYATNSAGTGYSNEISILTLKLPTLDATSIANINDNSAVAGSSVLDNGGGDIIKRGFCWGTAHDPTVDLITKSELAGGMGAFTSDITGLQGNTRYYVRSYAQNALGTSYGSEASFLTQGKGNYNKLSFQGYLTDLNGNALPDGNYNITFKIYTETAGIEEPLWLETQSVMLNSGVMSVILGGFNPISLNFDTSYYLGVTLEGQSELSPRFPLVGPLYPNGGFGR